jgi:hypothetical protein
MAETYEDQVKLISNILQELLMSPGVVGSANARERISGQSDRPKDVECRAAIEPSKMDRGVDFQVAGV